MVRKGKIVTLKHAGQGGCRDGVDATVSVTPLLFPWECKNPKRQEFYQFPAVGKCL